MLHVTFRRMLWFIESFHLPVGRGVKYCYKSKTINSTTNTAKTVFINNEQNGTLEQDRGMLNKNYA